MGSPVSRLSTAHRRLARSLLWGLGGMGLLSLLGPVLSYSIDSAEAQRQVRARGSHEARILADSVALRIMTMESELRRIARRPEVDFADESFEPEKILLQHSHEQSALFTGGVAVLDLTGKVVSATPPELFARAEGYSSRRWFQHALEHGNHTVLERFGEDPEGWALLVPVRAKSAVVGYILGVARAADQPLAFGLDPAQRVALVGGGEVLFELPETGRSPLSAFQRGAEARSPEGLEIEEGGAHYLAFAADVRGPVDLWVFNHFDDVVAPIRARLVGQLAFLAVVQLVTWLAFALFVCRTYLGFRDMETRITEEEKLAKLGVAANLIAHEVKNTLNGITAATSYPLPNGAGQEMLARVVKSQLARLSHVAKSLLALSKPARPQLAPLALEQVVREALESLKSLPEASAAQLHTGLAGSFTVEADHALASTAVDNVLRNAIEAAVAAKDVGKVPEARVSVRCEERGGQALLVVEDNGGGPPADFEEHAFEPFVTSKPKGIGLGLTTTRQAMSAMGGAVEFTRIPGGSRFVLCFRASAGTEKSP